MDDRIQSVNAQVAVTVAEEQLREAHELLNHPEVTRIGLIVIRDILKKSCEMLSGLTGSDGGPHPRTYQTYRYTMEFCEIKAYHLLTLSCLSIAYAIDSIEDEYVTETLKKTGSIVNQIVEAKK